MGVYKAILIVFAVIAGSAAFYFYVKHLFELGYDETDIYMHLSHDVPLRYLKRRRERDLDRYSGSPYKKHTPEHQKVDYDSYPSCYGANYDPKIAALMNAPPVDQEHSKQLLRSGGWQCACGKVNAVYVSSCSCGRNKHGETAPEPVPISDAISEDDELKNSAAIREYKKLMDDGIITAEEFEAKKKQLLGL